MNPRVLTVGPNPKDFFQFDPLPTVGGLQKQWSSLDRRFFPAIGILRFGGNGSGVWCLLATLSPPQAGSDGSQQFLRGDRFDQIIIRSQVHAFADILESTPTGQNQERDVPKLRVILLESEDIESV